MRVLVRLPNWLGDLLMARPLLHALSSTPAIEVWAIGPASAELLERDRVWRGWRRAGADGIHAPALEGSFDAALVLPPSFSSAWRLRARRISRRIGFASEARSWLLTDALRRPARGEMHLSEEYLLLGERLGIRGTTPPPLAASAAELAAARARLARLRSPGQGWVVLAPGAAYGPAKQWGFERFVALGRRLLARGQGVLVCGSAGDRNTALPIADAIGPGAHSLAGETSLEEQLALLSVARVAVSNDSGLAHLAAACGAPTVAIFGSTSSAWTAPLGPRVVVLQRAPVCSPCFQRTCAIGYRCLEAVTVDAVEAAALEVAQAQAALA